MKQQSKQYLSILGICSGCVVIALVFSMINSALPCIQKGLGISMNAAQWMMNVFGIVNCAILVTCGRLADIYGRKRMFMVGLAASLIAMVGGGFAATCGGLVLCMFFAGIGNAILLPVSQALLISEFPQEQKGRAIGIWAASIAAALAIGPVWGGVINGALGWQWVYWINAPVVGLSLLLVYCFSRESRNTLDPPVVDFWGMLFLGCTIAALAVWVTEFQSLTPLIRWGLMIFAAISLYGLLRVEKRCPSPILRGDLLRNSVFIAASIANACLVFYIWSIFFLLPHYLQHVRQLSPLNSGWMMLGITLPVALLSPLVGKMYQRRTAPLWIGSGFGLLLIFTALQFWFSPQTSLTFIAAATIFFGLAYSLIWSPSTTLAISRLSEQQAGISSGTFVTIQEIGGILGLATTVTVAKNFVDFEEGYHASLWILFATAWLGLGCTMALWGKTPSTQRH